MINYSLVERGNPSKKDAPQKIYASAQSKQVITLREIAEHISNHGSLFKPSVISGVVMEVAQCIREQLLAGNQVDLEDLGKFELSLRCEGAPSREEFTVRNITDVNVNWRPSKQFKNLRDEAEFCEGLTRKVEREKMKEKREG